MEYRADAEPGLRWKAVNESSGRTAVADGTAFGGGTASAGRDAFGPGVLGPLTLCSAGPTRRVGVTAQSASSCFNSLSQAART